MPGAARRFEPGSPGEELALGGDPFPQRLPSAEDSLVCHLGISAGLGGHGDEKPVGMVGQLTDQPPLLVRELLAEGAATRRLAVLAHGRAAQRENAPERSFGARMRRQKPVDAIDEHAAKLEGLRGMPQRPVAPAHHLRPHVVERVR